MGHPTAVGDRFRLAESLLDRHETRSGVVQ